MTDRTLIPGVAWSRGSLIEFGAGQHPTLEGGAVAGGRELSFFSNVLQPGRAEASGLIGFNGLDDEAVPGIAEAAGRELRALSSSNYPDLLPPNKTRLESAIAGPTGRIDHKIPVPIDLLLRPWECPAGYLPWLGWHLSLDLWDWRWDEHKKRSVIAQAVELHRKKGTMAGMKRHVRIMDGLVKQTVIPLQGTFASAAISKGEYDEWLRTMPQIRVFPAREVGSAVGLNFLRPLRLTQVVGGSPDEWESEPAHPTDTFLGYGFASFDAGRSLLGRAARLWDDGVLTPLNIVDLSTDRNIADGVRIERVSIPGHADDGLFVGRFLDHHFIDAVKVLAKVVTYRQDVNYEHSVSDLSMRSAHPGLEPVDVRSERISEIGFASQYAFVGRFLARKHPAWIFAGEDQAPWMLFDRIVLHDPARAVPRIGAWSFLNYTRLGHKKFVAKAVIDLKDKLHRSAFAVSKFVTPGFYLMAQDMTKHDRVRLSVRVSKAARDQILTTHKLTRNRTFDDGISLLETTPLARDARVPFRL